MSSLREQITVIVAASLLEIETIKVVSRDNLPTDKEIAGVAAPKMPMLTVLGGEHTYAAKSQPVHASSPEIGVSSLSLYISCYYLSQKDLDTETNRLLSVVWAKLLNTFPDIPGILNISVDLVGFPIQLPPKGFFSLRYDIRYSHAPDKL